MKRKAGRKPLLTKERMAHAKELVAGGALLKDVWVAIGVGKTSWYRWIDRGKEAKAGIYKDFFDALVGAEAELRERAAAQIVKSGFLPTKEVTTIEKLMKNPKTGEMELMVVDRKTVVKPPTIDGLEWTLARRFPKLFGRQSRQQLEHSGKIETPGDGANTAFGKLVAAALRSQDRTNGATTGASNVASNGTSEHGEQEGDAP